MRKLDASLIIFAALLTGCATPLPVKDSPKQASDSLRGQLKTFEDVKKNLAGFADTYEKAAKDLRETAQTNSETGFYASAFAVVGGMANSLSAALTGGAVAGGAGLLSDRYRMQQQAQNYEAAEDAMNCMFLASDDINTSLLNRSRFTVKSVEINAEQTITEIARDGLLTVRGRLYKLQTSLELAKPDIAKMKAALGADPQPVSSTVAAKAELQRTDLTSAQKAEADARAEATAKNEELLGDFKNKIDVCVAKITG